MNHCAHPPSPSSYPFKSKLLERVVYSHYFRLSSPTHPSALPQNGSSLHKGPKGVDDMKMFDCLNEIKYPRSLSGFK